MNRTDQNPDAMLDAIVGEVRADNPEPHVVEEAGRRVWQRLAASLNQPDAIQNCAGFQALFPAFRDNTLSPSRRMLVEDHLHECVACRKTFHSETAPKPTAPVAVMPQRTGWMPAKWAIAAALVIGVGLGSWYTYDSFGPAPAGARARVLAADGGVYRLSGASVMPVSTGAELGDRDLLRTAGGGHATVRLLDGSTVEAGERAEFSVSADRRDTTVHLERGQIIVQAARRRTGHLYVASADSRVAVTGTVFSVNRGVAGSRVSVVEGEVHVQHGNENNVLHAGDQLATHPSMAKTSVLDEIAWSRNYDQYMSLLKQFAEIKGKLSQVQMPGLRYSTRLLDSVPEGTAIYVSVPNLGNAIRDLQRIVNDQARQSPELQAWMQTQLPQFEKVTQHLTRIGDYLGDEIVFASQSCKGFCGILIAEVSRPGLREYIDTEMAKAGADPRLMGNMKIVFAGNKVIIGEQPAFIQAAERGGSRFASTPFGQTVSEVYKRGAGLFAAANLEDMMRGEAPDDQRLQSFSRLGIDRVRHLIAEQREVNGRAEYSAAVTFSGERQGVASWIAAPGAMGSLSFVSPDAQFAASFVVKQPAQMLQDVMTLAPAGSRSDSNSDEFRKAFGVGLEQLASYLGGEVTVAVDGPLIPTPAWKLIAEVRDPAGLEAALTQMVEAANIQLRAAGQPEAVLTRESVNGRMYYSLRAAFGQATVQISYVIADGYLIATPGRTLLDRTLGDRAAGITLARSQQFTKLLPRESRTTFSGIIYQNAGELIRLMSESAAAVQGRSSEQQRKAEEIASNLEPMLVCIYGEKDRIEVASQSVGMNLLMQTMAGQMLPRAAFGASDRTKKDLRSY